MHKTMELNELVENYRSVYGGFDTWDQLLQDVRANFYESWALDALVAELQARGSFRKPVLLGLEEDWGDADEDLQEPRSTHKAVLDGAKRVLAHLVLELPQIEVDDLGESIYVLGGELDRYMMSTKVDIPPAADQRA